MFNFQIRALPTLPLAAALAAVLTAMIALPASAHITLETQQAPVGSYYKAVFHVPHGCKGSDTLKIRVQIPEGVLSVKPQPKTGWKLETVDAAYPKAYEVHGSKVTSGVREVSWTGRLPNAYYEEFTFLSYLAPELTAGTVVRFPVVQECEKGVSRWIDTKEPSENPAPKLSIVPKP
ncbi:YcnI family protein [Herbaspirillum sp. RTI4]|uniref:YcnI family copper-binding membrane protein n=1 Tax=Herbaspirillum sp. RTI4 TaxID=3048640 RepID=UPI002AB50584|nr:YcnI family protein [Herbaspirillum sp. RTI4]MDY7579415.1 YcnI family protein [Herbaspirillum sp. RTI4]MEA9980329.1 YcnI family protein [Herbaspirillum sp. RTI4]